MLPGIERKIAPSRASPERSVWRMRRRMRIACGGSKLPMGTSVLKAKVKGYWLLIIAVVPLNFVM